MLLVGGFEMSIVLDDFGDEGVSDKGLLFLSFVVKGGKVCTVVFAMVSSMIWEVSFPLPFFELTFIGAAVEVGVITISVKMVVSSNQSRWRCIFDLFDIFVRWDFRCC